MSDNQYLGMDEAAAAVMHQDSSAAAASIRNNVQFAIDANPDQEAQYRRLAAATGTPIQTVRAEPDTIRRQVAAVNVNAGHLIAYSPRVAQFLTNMDNARLIHDDVPGTANVEGAAKKVANAGGARPPADAATAWEPSIGQRIRMWLDDAFGLTQQENARAWVQYASKRERMNPSDLSSAIGAGGVPAVDLPLYQATGKFLNAVSFGVIPDMAGTPNSTVGAVAGGAGTLLGFVRGPVAAVENMAEFAGIKGLEHVAGESFAKALAKDVTVQSIKLGTAGAMGAMGTAIDSPDLTTAAQKEIHAFTSNAGVGAVFGAAGRLLPDPGFLQTVARVAGIQSSLDLMNGKMPYQDVANWDNLTPAEKGDAAFNIMLNGFFGMHGAGRTSGGWFRDAAKADAAGEDMQALQALSQLSAASKLRERDPAAFKQFVETVAEDGVSNVYVDAVKLTEVLNQSGIKAEDIQKLMPEVAAQINEAVQTKGDVRISLADYATHIAGTPADEALLPNLKTAPDGMTYAQSQEFQQTQTETLKAAIEQVTQEKAVSDVVQADRKQVYDKVLEQLNATGRFTPDVNKQNAALQTALYSSQADRLGISASELYARYPLTINAERLGGADLEQALASHPPEGWKHIENGEDAAGLWSGEDKSSAVFWTDLGGALKDEAPALSGYSHSISASTVAHIKGRHSSDSEALSGQVAITEKDIAAIPVVVQQYDAVRTDLTGKQGQPMVGYAKRLSDGVLIYLESASSKRQNLSGVSMWKIDSQKSPADLLQSVLTEKTKGQNESGPSDDAPRPLSDYESDAQTPPSEESIAATKGEFKQSNGARGAYSPESNTITLLKDADLSTFLHESGHQFLEMLGDIAGQKDAPAGLVEDFHTLLQWMGVKDSETWRSLDLEARRDGHEQFARGFEAYLLEGKAPSVELSSMFARFRSWLIHVYKSLTSLNVELTPEVRGVLGRLLATDEAIKQAEQVRGYEPLFKSAEAAGMSPEEFAEYQKTGAEATVEAIEQLQRRSLRDMKWLSNAKSRALKAVQAEADSARKAIKEQVTAEVMAEPINRARTWLTKGEMTDENGATVKSENGYKLSVEDVRRMYPDDAPNRPDLNRLRGMVEKGGVHPDIAAEKIGEFSSGRELIDALINGENAKDKIEGMTDQRMLEQHGDLNSPDAIERAAEAAIHNEVRARFVATELRALAKATGPARAIAAAAKQAAEGAIAAKKLRDIQVGQYTVAEAKAARNAEKALMKGDTTAAANEKRAQLLNNRLVRAARDALDREVRTVNYFKKFDKPSIRKNLDPDVLNQIDVQLERFDLRQAPPEGPTKAKQRLDQWVESAKQNGFTPYESADMLNPSVKMHYKDMTFEQFVGLHDTIKSLEHIARERKQVTVDGKRVALDSVAEKLVAKLKERGDKFTDKELVDAPRLGVDPWWKVALDRMSSFLRLSASEFKGQQFKANQFDMHEIQGPWRTLVFDRIFDANYHKLDMLKSLSDQVREKFRTELGLDWAKTLVDVVPNTQLMDHSLATPALRRITRGDMLGIARHVGNESNFDKLAQGMGWEPDSIWQFLKSNMKAKDWRAVQIEWDLLGVHWGEVEAMNRRLGNTSPERIEPRAFSVIDAQTGKVIEMRGGYAPLRYDPVRSRLAEKKRDASAINPADGLFSRDYYRADTTTNGSLNARTANYYDFLDLDFHSVERALHDTIHDLAYREALIDAHKMITHPDVHAQFMRTYGPETYRHMQEWLGRIANSSVADEKTSVLARILSTSRRAVVANGIAFRLSTMEKHGGSAGLKSAGYFSGGGMKYLLARASAIGTNHTAEVKGAMEKFSEIRARALQQDRDYKQVVASLYEPESLHGKAERFGHAGVAWLDFLTAVPTAWAAYDRAITEGIPTNRGGTGKPMSEKDAVAYANSIVREAHGSNIESSRSMLMSSQSELVKTLTVLHGFMNNTLGQHMDLMDKAKVVGFSKPEIAARYLMTMIVPAIFTGWLSGEFGDEPWWESVAKSIGGEYSAQVPLVRDAYHAAEGYHSAGLPPWMSVVGSVAKPAHDLYDVSRGVEVKHPIKDIGNAAGLAIPGLGQIGSTSQFLYDVATDKVRPEGAADWVQGVSHGSVKKH